MMWPRLRDYPSVLLVRDSLYDIVFRDRIRHQDVGECDGVCCYETERLLVRKKQGSKKDRFSTAIHEALHAMNEEWNIKLTHAQIYGLERAIIALIDDNF